MRIILRNDILGIRKGNAGAKNHAVILPVNFPQPVNLSDKNRRRDIAQLFRHPQAHIGCARNNGCARRLGQNRRQIVDICGQDRHGRAVRHRHPTTIPQGHQPVRHRRAFPGKVIRARTAIIIDGQGGANDRGIARTSAQIALDRGFHLLRGRARGLHPQGIKRHHKTGCAKSALAAVMLDHGLLHRVQPPVRPLQILHRHHVTAIQRGQEPNTGIHRLIAQPGRRQTAHQHRAGAAIAFGTAFLGARQTPVDAQKI